MKAKLTVTIDEELIPQAKASARARGLSLSQLIENLLRGVEAKKGGSFAARWRGRFRPAARDTELYRALAKKHL